MPINVDKLLVLCNFYKSATLESDMAKRIMVSVIPSMMSKTETHYSGGFDYKALRSAVNGAKDLVKYGTRACVGEMEFYGAGLREKYDQIRSMRAGDLDDEKYNQIKTLKDKYNNIEKVKRKARQLKDEDKYKECLDLCTKSFNDVEVWDSAYGGVAWGKISGTLLQLEEKREFLQMLRQEAGSPQADRKTDYVQLELETMREMIVLMNVFDGLAHNTGSVMPKVVQEELNEFKRHRENSGAEYDHEEEEYRDRKYQKQIQTLMDVKEIDDPFTVYKEVQSIIEQPENRHLFGDWVTKLRSHPEYQTAKSLKERKAELALIKARKQIKALLPKIETEIYAVNAAKDSLLNVHDNQDGSENPARKSAFNHLYQAVNSLYKSFGGLTAEISNIVYSNPILKANVNALTQAITKSKITEHIYSMRDRSSGAAKYHEGIYVDDINQLITDASKLRKMYSVVPNAIDQYIEKPISNIKSNQDPGFERDDDNDNDQDHDQED